MKARDTYSIVKLAVAIVGISAAGFIFWHALAWFMWACYYAGIKM